MANRQFFRTVKAVEHAKQNPASKRQMAHERWAIVFAHFFKNFAILFSRFQEWSCYD
jgi:hypothetical protein